MSQNFPLNSFQPPHSLLRVSWFCFMMALMPFFAFSQSASTGTITGRVLNPATGDYLRNAVVRIPATGQSAIAGNGGGYRLSGVTPGRVEIEISYTGLTTMTATVEVAAGSTVSQDFRMTSSRDTHGDDSDVISLDAFVVSTAAREGAAKAIMDQRNSMNITNTVSSDSFGDVAEGNVGEFLKHMPGVILNLVEGEVRNVSLRGLGPEYTGVTLDGVSMASADANSGAAGDARAFGFEQASLSSMESIEVTKTISADVDANAPAGTINLKTKRAFDREGRRITVQANGTLFGREMTLGHSPGPSDKSSRKIEGGGIVEFSDVFFDNRLGIVMNVSESNVYSEIYHTTLSYDTNATAADPRIAVPTSFSTFHGPRTNRRAAMTFKGDFKATENLTLSMLLMYNESDLAFYYRNLTFATGGSRTAVQGSDPLVSLTSTGAGVVTVNPIMVAKQGATYTATPTFEYRKDDLLIEGRFSASDSESTYRPQSRGEFRTLGGPRVSGVTFTAERSSPLSGDWQYRQIAGPDISDGNNYDNRTIETEDKRYNRVQLFSGAVDATLKTNNFGIPIEWKTGVKKMRDIRDFDITRDAYRYDYTGPDAGVGAWADYNSPFGYNLDAGGSSATSLSGGNVFYPDMLRIFELYQDHPEQFTQSFTPTNFYNARVANKKHYEEDIAAAFFMGTASIDKWTIRAGMRYEETTGLSREFDPLSGDEVRAGGFPASKGRATTIPGLEYQYFSRPLVDREGSYDHWHPSASVKYAVLPNFDLHFGYSNTIRRPTFRDVAGVWTIDDESLTVSAPNTSIEPEISDNLSVRAAYYFEPVGIIAINFFQNTVKGLFQSTQLTAQEFGYTGAEDLSDYLFNTTVSSDNEIEVKGMELEYSQSFSFLPGVLSGLNFRASYTRNYADIIITNMAPHSASAGLGYSWGRYNVYSNVNWHDNQPLNTANTRYRRHRMNMDVGGGVQLTDKFSMFINVRNVLDEPYLDMQQFDNGSSAARKYEVFGTNFTFGVKGVF